MVAPTDETIRRPKLPWATSVLVIAEDAERRRRIRNALLMRGFFVEAASSGHEAAMLLRKLHRDVVIADAPDALVELDPLESCRSTLIVFAPVAAAIRWIGDCAVAVVECALGLQHLANCVEQATTRRR
jgi:DNA-binding NtrC family response regulator